MVLWIVLQILLGHIYGTFAEWLIHKEVLHRLGKYKDSFFSFHWHSHHKIARKNNMSDLDYLTPWWKSLDRAKEVLGIILIDLVHLPLLFFAPAMYLYLVIHGFAYYFMHKRAHLNPVWAIDNLTWHLEHHMGLDQDKNYCITSDWLDRLLGTRRSYSGILLNKPPRDL